MTQFLHGSSTFSRTHPAEKEPSIIQAQQFLNRMSNNGRFPLYISDFREMRDAKLAPAEFITSALYLDCLGYYQTDSQLTHQIIKYLKSSILPDLTVCFTEDIALMPADTETTSFIAGLLWELGALSTDTAQKIADRVLENKNEQGRVYIYFEREDKPDRRLDYVSSLNVLTFLGQLGREEEAASTIAWIDEIIATKAFCKGSYYYHSPSSFFYFAARLVKRVPKLGQRWIKQLQEALVTYKPDPHYPIELSTTITAKVWLQVPFLSSNIETLKRLQKPSGAWPADSLYHLGTAERYFGNEIMSTTFAAQALMEFDQAF
ncbi:MAG TPA: hypothetical protein V6D11_22240 [Waterburya sp.]|jgi:hypothetical protein